MTLLLPHPFDIGQIRQTSPAYNDFKIVDLYYESR
jgi:hypothetical protein